MTTIDLTGLTVYPALRARITAAMNETLERLPLAPTLCRVAFFDDNGPKNAPAIRCAITIRLPRRPAIRVEHVGDTVRLAFDGAHDTLARRLRELSARTRDLRRRPKKYFAARRTLATG